MVVSPLNQNRSQTSLISPEWSQCGQAGRRDLEQVENNITLCFPGKLTESLVGSLWVGGPRPRAGRCVPSVMAAAVFCGFDHMVSCAANVCFIRVRASCVVNVCIFLISSVSSFAVVFTIVCRWLSLCIVSCCVRCVRTMSAVVGDSRGLWVGPAGGLGW